MFRRECWRALASTAIVEGVCIDVNMSTVLARGVRRLEEAEAEWAS